MVDELTAAFGPIKVRWCEEGGKTIGTRPEFDGIDVDKLIRLDDARNRKTRGKA
jgi:hypothetical protein